MCQGRKLTFRGTTLFTCTKYENGGAEGDRTPDLLNAIQALSQLSYTPVKHRVTVHCHATRGYYITRQTVCQELFEKNVRKPSASKFSKQMQQCN